MTHDDDAAARRFGPAKVTPRPRGVTIARALGAAAFLALLLAACLQPPPPPPPADPLEPTDDRIDVPSAVVDLAPGEWADYLLVLDDIRSFDVAYVELVTTQPAVVELRGATYWGVLASSDRPDYFVRGAISGVPQPVPGASSELEPAAITKDLICGGPCVIFRPTGRFYVRVVNTGDTDLVADLFLYGESFADPYEPDNDLPSSAPPLANGESGSLELLGDVDYWRATVEANVRVDPLVNGLAVEVTVFDGCGLQAGGPYGGGATFRVYPGEAVRVRAAQNRAAPSGRSAYFVTVGAPSGGAEPRDPGCVEVVAGTDRDTPVANVFMSGGSTTVFAVSVPSSVRSRDVIQFEVEGEARLEVVGGSASYVSTSPDVFFAGSASSSAPPTVAPASVVEGRLCSGPCVIDPDPSPGYLLRVRNLGGARAVRLYAFGRSFDDTTEPDNDSLATAHSIAADGVGAIESVGDADIWYVPTTGTVGFESAAGGPTLVADVLDRFGNVLTPGLLPGSIAVRAGEFVRVRAADPDAAAVSGRSQYFLFY